MLKLNYKSSSGKPLNTSYVEVKLSSKCNIYFTPFHLNTSYVEVKLMYVLFFLYFVSHLNTSYVEVKLNAILNNIENNTFKYILC